MNHRNPTERLEDELDRAKGLGRWLSDDEQAELDRAADAVAERLEARKRRQRKLVVLTAVCLLIPPLWPLALGLTLFLEHPCARGVANALTASAAMRCAAHLALCLLYTSPSPRDRSLSRMPSSA